MKTIKKLWEIGNSSLIILLMFFWKVDLVGLVEKKLSSGLQKNLMDPTFRLTINSAFAFLIIQFSLTLFTHLMSLETNINNISGTTTSEINSASQTLSHRSKIIYVDISVDYRSKLNKWLVSLFGGVYLFIYNTKFTTIQVDKVKTSYPLGVIDDTLSCEYIKIKIDDIFGINEIRKDNIRIICDISSNSPSTVGLSGEISTAVVSKKNNLIMNTIIKILVGSNNSEHKIQSIT